MANEHIFILVAWPLSSQATTRLGSPGFPSGWETKGSGLLRQVRHLGNRSFQQAKTWNSPPLDDGHSLLADIVPIRGTVYSVGKTLQVGIACLQATNPNAAISTLVKVGQSQIQELALRSFGWTLDKSATVNATMIVSSKTFVGELSSGALTTPSFKDLFTFEVTYTPVVASIAIERLLIEAATSALGGRDFLALTLRNHLAMLENWLTIPASDSSWLLREVRDLRNTLSLDERHSQVKSALSHRITNANVVLAVFGGTLGLSLTFMSLLMQLINPNGGVLPVLAASVLIATTSAITTQLLTRGK